MIGVVRSFGAKNAPKLCPSGINNETTRGAREVRLKLRRHFYRHLSNTMFSFM